MVEQVPLKASIRGAHPLATNAAEMIAVAMAEAH
jgi:hypothetical protein